ncbi:major facilitator superfamily domain-containing protein [Lineolata rhizophorae]|uniref:Major facilitator superfamily domain-containing protein n=1 Tax=Lineolata rhizophorae TaxID=578093 RepID=A0A6A6NUK7_9PEZI|nr:major facilitator superfamily domain-containing protein [Lineolata rhizophorae]
MDRFQDDPTEPLLSSRPDTESPNGETSNTETSDASAAPKPSTEFKATSRTYTAYVMVMVLTLTEALDSTIVSVALPVSPHNPYGGNTAATFALGTSYLLASTTLQPIFASVSNVFGRKPLLLIALFTFAVGLAIASAGNSSAVVLLGRTLQGVGSAGSNPLAVMILTDIVPLKERPRWLGNVGIMWMLGGLAGPPIGGGLAATNWRAVFWVCLPLIAVCFVVTMLFLRLKKTQGRLKHMLSRLDYVGMLLFLPASFLVLLTLTWLSTKYPWLSAEVLVPLSSGIGLMILFVMYERNVEAEPLIRLEVFGNPTSKIAYFGTVIHALVFFMTVYYLPVYYQGVQGYSSTRAGLAMLAVMLSNAPVNALANRSIQYSQRYRWAVWTGWGLTTLGLGLMCLLDTSTRGPVWVVITLTAGAGFGVLGAGQSTTTQAANKSENQARSQSAYLLVRGFGQTLGVAVGVAIFQNRLKSSLQGYDMGDHIAADTLLQYVKSADLAPEERAMLQKAIADALRVLWATGCGLAGLAGLLSCFIKGYPLDQDPDSKHSPE